MPHCCGRPPEPVARYSYLTLGAAPRSTGLPLLQPTMPTLARAEEARVPVVPRPITGRSASSVADGHVPQKANGPDRLTDVMRPPVGSDSEEGPRSPLLSQTPLKPHRAAVDRSIALLPEFDSIARAGNEPSLRNAASTTNAVRDDDRPLMESPATRPRNEAATPPADPSDRSSARGRTSITDVKIPGDPHEKETRSDLVASADPARADAPDPAAPFVGAYNPVRRSADAASERRADNIARRPREVRIGTIEIRTAAAPPAPVIVHRPASRSAAKSDARLTRGYGRTGRDS
jgi:hypothetical protein